MAPQVEYASLVKQRAFATGDQASAGPSPHDNTAFLDALRCRAMDELHEAALEYGIILKEVAVLDRNFKGKIAETIDGLVTRSLQAQVEASNVDRENSNKVKVQEGQLQVAQVQAQQRQVSIYLDGPQSNGIADMEWRSTDRGRRGSVHALGQCSRSGRSRRDQGARRRSGHADRCRG